MQCYLGTNWKLVGDDEDLNYRKSLYLKCMSSDTTPSLECTPNFDREFPNYNCVGYVVGGKGRFLSVLYKPTNIIDIDGLSLD